MVHNDSLKRLLSFFSQDLQTFSNSRRSGVVRELVKKRWIIVRRWRSCSPVCLSSHCHICRTGWGYPTRSCDPCGPFLLRVNNLLSWWFQASSHVKLYLKHLTILHSVAIFSTTDSLRMRLRVPNSWQPAKATDLSYLDIFSGNNLHKNNAMQRFCYFFPQRVYNLLLKGFKDGQNAVRAFKSYSLRILLGWQKYPSARLHPIYIGKIQIHNYNIRTLISLSWDFFSSGSLQKFCL